MLETKQFTTVVDGKTITIETGKLAGQAGGAVTIRQGDTVLLVTATMDMTPREGITFFPLRVDYEERLYAGGRIPGSVFRREGRPSETAILIARLVDRPIRPLFPKDLLNDVQVILYALSSDGGTFYHNSFMGYERADFRMFEIHSGSSGFPGTCIDNSCSGEIPKGQDSSFYSTQEDGGSTFEPAPTPEGGVY